MIRSIATFLCDLVDGRSTEMKLKQARVEGFNQGFRRGLTIGRESAEAELLGAPISQTILELQAYANSGGES